MKTRKLKSKRRFQKLVAAEVTRLKLEGIQSLLTSAIIVFKAALGFQAFVWAVVWLFAVALASLAHAAESATPSFHIAFSGSMCTDINVNDAKAALKAWFVTIAKERRINTDPEPWIVDDTLALAALLRSNRIDAVEMTAAEYVAFEKEAKFNPLFVASSGGLIAEEYVVVTHQDCKIEKLADLRGRNGRREEAPPGSMPRGGFLETRRLPIPGPANP